MSNQISQFKLLVYETIKLMIKQVEDGILIKNHVE